jgi:hypothetical protein
MELSDKVAGMINEWSPMAVFVDAVGVGAGVVDRLRQLNFTVQPFNGGSKPMNQEVYANERAEVWGEMKKWLSDGGSIPDDRHLKEQLCGVRYRHDVRNRLLMERKEDMKGRGMASPDIADSLSMTFAVPFKEDYKPKLAPHQRAIEDAIAYGEDYADPWGD